MFKTPFFNHGRVSGVPWACTLNQAVFSLECLRRGACITSHLKKIQAVSWGLDLWVWVAGVIAVLPCSSRSSRSGYRNDKGGALELLEIFDLYSCAGCRRPEVMHLNQVNKRALQPRDDRLSQWLLLSARAWFTGSCSRLTRSTRPSLIFYFALGFKKKTIRWTRRR